MGSVLGSGTVPRFPFQALEYETCTKRCDPGVGGAAQMVVVGYACTWRRSIMRVTGT